MDSTVSNGVQFYSFILVEVGLSLSTSKSPVRWNRSFQAVLAHRLCKLPHTREPVAKTASWATPLLLRGFEHCAASKTSEKLSISAQQHTLTHYGPDYNTGKLVNRCSGREQHIERHYDAVWRRGRRQRWRRRQPAASLWRDGVRCACRRHVATDRVRLRRQHAVRGHHVAREEQVCDLLQPPHSGRGTYELDWCCSVCVFCVLVYLILKKRNKLVAFILDSTTPETLQKWRTVRQHVAFKLAADSLLLEVDLCCWKPLHARCCASALKTSRISEHKFPSLQPNELFEDQWLSMQTSVSAARRRVNKNPRKQDWFCLVILKQKKEPTSLRWKNADRIFGVCVRVQTTSIDLPNIWETRLNTRMFRMRGLWRRYQRVCFTGG